MPWWCLALLQVQTGVQEGAQALEACLTADGQYLLSGCEDRCVRVWHVESGQEVSTGQGNLLVVSGWV